MSKKQLKPGKVYTKKLDEERTELFWLNARGEVKRAVRRGDNAKRYAKQIQRALDQGLDGAEDALPFGDQVESKEGLTGQSWLELLWTGALMVANNPTNKTVQSAYRAIATGANAARKFIVQEEVGEEEPTDKEFVDMVAHGVADMDEQLREKLLQALMEAAQETSN